MYGRVHLDAASGLGEFVFDKELQNAVAKAFRQLEAMVPQKPLSSPAVADLLRDHRVCHHASVLLETLSVVVFSATRTGVKPTDDILGYTLLWLSSQLAAEPMQVLAETAVGRQSMVHLRALYETLEGYLAKVAAEELHQQYCEDIPQLVVAELSGSVQVSLQAAAAEGEDETLFAVPLLGAIRSFVYRFLRSASAMINPEDELFVYLEDGCAWPVGAYKVCRLSVLPAISPVCARSCENPMPRASESHTDMYMHCTRCIAKGGDAPDVPYSLRVKHTYALMNWLDGQIAKVGLML